MFHTSRLRRGIRRGPSSAPTGEMTSAWRPAAAPPEPYAPFPSLSICAPAPPPTQTPDGNAHFKVRPVRMKGGGSFRISRINFVQTSISRGCTHHPTSSKSSPSLPTPFRPLLPQRRPVQRRFPRPVPFVLGARPSRPAKHREFCDRDPSDPHTHGAAQRSVHPPISSVALAHAVTHS